MAPEMVSRTVTFAGLLSAEVDRAATGWAALVTYCVLKCSEPQAQTKLEWQETRKFAEDLPDRSATSHVRCFTRECCLPVARPRSNELRMDAPVEALRPSMRPSETSEPSPCRQRDGCSSTWRPLGTQHSAVVARASSQCGARLLPDHSRSFQSRSQVTPGRK